MFDEEAPRERILVLTLDKVGLIRVALRARLNRNNNEEFKELLTELP